MCIKGILLFFEIEKKGIFGIKGSLSKKVVILMVLMLMPFFSMWKKIRKVDMCGYGAYQRLFPSNYVFIFIICLCQVALVCVIMTKTSYLIIVK